MLRVMVRAHTHSVTHALPDASSPLLLIAGDSSHCERQCSPSLCCAVITLAALILSPFLLSSAPQLYTSLPYISSFLPLSIYHPLFLLLSSYVCCDVVLTLFTLQCSTRNQGNYISNPEWVSFQIMAIDLCLYYVFSGTLFTTVTRSSLSVAQHCHPVMLSSTGVCVTWTVGADFFLLCRFCVT